MYLIISGDCLQEAEVIIAVVFQQVLLLSWYRLEALSTAGLRMSVTCIPLGLSASQGFMLIGQGRVVHHLQIVV